MSRLRGVADADCDSRRGMYKMKSPSWKETYRSRCLNRLRENRSKFHSMRRNITTNQDNNNSCKEGSGVTEDDDEEDPLPVATATNGNRGGSGGVVRGASVPGGGDTDMLSIEEIMEQEWNKMGSDTKEEGVSSVDSLVSLYEEVCSELKQEIQLDLQREEEELLRMHEICEAELQYEEDELCQAVQALSTDEVICPLCSKSTLIENKGVILCVCGLRVDTEQDCISMKQIKASLQSATDEHSRLCEARPEFSVSHKFGITNILMACSDCDFLFIIL